MKVLIVEDSEPMRRTIKGFIEDIAEVVHECSDGAQALTQYAKHHPDWVLMDIKMKDMDGLAATRQILAAFPEARIVIVTSYGEPSFRDEAQSAGAVGYVLKENLADLPKILTAKS